MSLDSSPRTPKTPGEFSRRRRGGLLLREQARPRAAGFLPSKGRQSEAGALLAFGSAEARDRSLASFVE